MDTLLQHVQDGIAKQIQLTYDISEEELNDDDRAKMARIIKLINSAVVITLVTATVLGVSYALKCMISAKIEEERENKQRLAQEAENTQQEPNQ